MRKINIIGAFTVLICNIVVSFNHSLDLFRSGGFEGWLAWVAVIGCEVTFIMGALNIVVSRMQGDHPGAPAIVGGLLGVLLVGWSNVAAGWAFGITGILLGLATPISLIVAEMILSRAFLQQTAQGSGEAVQKSPNEPEPSPTITQQEEPTTQDLEEINEEERAFQTALSMYEETKEQPSRRSIQAKANCSEHYARKAWNHIKEIIGSEQNEQQVA